MEKTIRKPKGYWKSRDNIIEESKKYSSRTEFKKKSGNAYDMARYYKILDEMTWLDNDKGRHPKGYWKNKENMLNEAKKYKTKEEFKNGNITAFLAAYRYGYIDDLIWMVQKKEHKNGWWTYEHIEEEALKYKTKTDFFKGNQSAYRKALEMGIIDDFFSLNDYVE